MRHETVLLDVPGAASPTELVTYVPDNLPELGMDRQRPAIIICPGGGYSFLSPREAEPVALRFAGLGYAAFILRYHVGEVGRYPIPQRQALAAVAHVKENCNLYHVDPLAVVVLGFSAGGHVAGCAGTMWNWPEVTRPLKKKASLLRPDGMVLCYPVISSGPHRHKDSFLNLLGEDFEEKRVAVSLELQVTEETPPTFLWHTADDTTVPVENTMMMKRALQAKGVEAEVHIYPHGRHGQSLADRTVYSPENMWKLSVPCSTWVERCHQWLQRTFCQESMEDR